MRLLAILIGSIFFRIRQTNFKEILRFKKIELTESDLLLKDIIEHKNALDIHTSRSFTYNEILYYIEDDNSLLYTYKYHSRICYPSFLIKEIRTIIKEIITNEKDKLP